MDFTEMYRINDISYTIPYKKTTQVLRILSLAVKAANMG